MTRTGGAGHWQVDNAFGRQSLTMVWGASHSKPAFPAALDDRFNRLELESVERIIDDCWAGTSNKAAGRGTIANRRIQGDRQRSILVTREISPTTGIISLATPAYLSAGNGRIPRQRVDFGLCLSA